MSNYHIAQVNLGRVKGQPEDPIMAGFMNRLDEVNAIADRAPGFVWRLQTDSGNATDYRPYPGDNSILLNMSVWETVEALRDYVYKTVHVELLRQRHLWFEKFDGIYTALWWVPAGHTPTIEEAVQRLAYLEEYGPTEYAFTMQIPFPAPSAGACGIL